MKIDVASLTANLSRDLSRIIDARLSDGDSASPNDGAVAGAVREWLAALTDSDAVEVAKTVLWYCYQLACECQRDATSEGPKRDEAIAFRGELAAIVRDVKDDEDEFLARVVGPKLATAFPMLADAMSRAGTTNNESENQS